MSITSLYDTSCYLATSPMIDKSDEVIEVNAPFDVFFFLTYRLRHVAMEFKERQM